MLLRRVYTVQQVAAALGCSQNNVRNRALNVRHPPWRSWAATDPRNPFDVMLIYAEDVDHQLRASGTTPPVHGAWGMFIDAEADQRFAPGGRVSAEVDPTGSTLLGMTIHEQVEAELRQTKEHLAELRAQRAEAEHARLVAVIEEQQRRLVELQEALDETADTVQDLAGRYAKTTKILGSKPRLAG